MLPVKSAFLIPKHKVGTIGSRVSTLLSGSP